MEVRGVEKLDYETTVHCLTEDIFYYKRKLSDLKAEVINIESKILRDKSLVEHYKRQIDAIDQENDKAGEK